MLNKYLLFISPLVVSTFVGCRDKDVRVVSQDGPHVVTQERNPKVIRTESVVVLTPVHKRIKGYIDPHNIKAHEEFERYVAERQGKELAELSKEENEAFIYRVRNTLADAAHLAKDKTAQAAKVVNKKAHQAADVVKDVAGTAYDKAKDIVTHAKDVVVEKAHDLKDKAQEVATATKEKAEELNERAVYEARKAQINTRAALTYAELEDYKLQLRQALNRAHTTAQYKAIFEELERIERLQLEIQRTRVK